MRYSTVREDAPSPRPVRGEGSGASGVQTPHDSEARDGRAVQTPHDTPEDQARDILKTAAGWLDLSHRAHENVHMLLTQYLTACEWRKQCLRMTTKYGATHREIAEKLTISKSQIAKLLHGK